MPRIHEPEYHELAKYYDLMNEKYVPYEKHFGFIEGAFEKYHKKVHSILDLVCGTGIHSLYFARKGYKVVGVDLSKSYAKYFKAEGKDRGT